MRAIRIFWLPARNSIPTIRIFIRQVRPGGGGSYFMSYFVQVLIEYIAFYDVFLYPLIESIDFYDVYLYPGKFALELFFFS